LRARVASAIYNQMVVCGSLAPPELDRLFRALADATRRDILARLLTGEPSTVSSLAARYDMSFAAVQKHVAVLEDAQLVSKVPRGRERVVRGDPERLARAREALTQLEDLWRSRFGQLDAVLSPRANAPLEDPQSGLFSVCAPRRPGR
jgi:DNA-binding transcriptional ArsR family regulator